MQLLRLVAEHLLRVADIRIDGGRPWDIQVHDRRAFIHALCLGSIGFGDAYVAGWWTCEDLEEMAFRVARARLEEKVAERLPGGLAARLLSALFNQQTRLGSLQVAKRHYNLGNDLFLSFLGARKNYSCGYFKDTHDLDVAQAQKLELLCRKLRLRPGERLLDIGGGWGEFARYAAKHHGVRVTSINIADEQIRFARDYCRGLDVEVLRCDYRNVTGRFDKVAAIAMFTHVGYRNYRAFFSKVHEVLEPDGVFVMEGIWGSVAMKTIDAWIEKHIFPNSQLPSAAQTFGASEGLFSVEHLHNFGHAYAQTLRAWKRNLEAAWPALAARYDDAVLRVFQYYFSMCAGYFRARSVHNWQLVFSKRQLGHAPRPWLLDDERPARPITLDPRALQLARHGHESQHAEDAHPASERHPASEPSPPSEPQPSE